MTDDDKEFNSLLIEELDLLGLRQRVIFWDTFRKKINSNKQEIQYILWVGLS
jgi:hypothetical protein